MSALAFSDNDSDLDTLAILSDTSDSDTTHCQEQKIRRLNYMQSLEDFDFTFKFRLPKHVVQSLLTKLMPFVPVTSERSHEVSPLHQLLLTLRFYALGSFLVSVTDFIGVSAPTASRVVCDMSLAISKLYEETVVVHENHNVKFYQIGGIPRVLGIIDSMHIQLQSPRYPIDEKFRNQKGYYSIKVQALCDADMKFMDVEARWPGSTPDSKIFNNSVLKDRCDAGRYKYCMLGDSAYPDKRYLLTPVPNAVTQPEHQYNEAHLKTWNIIEKTFDTWKRRFPVVALKIRLTLQNAQAVIIATAVLHNICRELNLDEIPSEIEIPKPENMDEINNDGAQDSFEKTNLINNFFS